MGELSAVFPLVGLFAVETVFQDALNRITKRQLKTVDQLYSSKDQIEGAKAFAEKRAPKWKGK